MFNQYQWNQSSQTEKGNVYFYYPPTNALFISEYMKSGGLITYIYKNENLIEIKEREYKKEWTSDVFTNLKTMTINGKKFESIYSNCCIFSVPNSYRNILNVSKLLTEQFYNAFKKYVEDLDTYNKQNSQELEKLCLDGRVRQLFTTKENKPFYATGRDKSIKPITQDVGEGISPFTETILNRIINGEKYEHANYHDAIFDDILNKENLSFAYWLITTNRNSDYAFDALERFPKEKIIKFKKPNSKMQEGEIAFIYVAHTHSIPIKARIREIYRDKNNSENNYYILEFESFIDEITLDELKRVGFSPESLVKTQEFKRTYLSNIYAKRTRDERNKDKDNYTPNTQPVNETIFFKQQSLNQILYGPPGTGKTYYTIDMALEILVGYDKNLELPNQDDRKARKELFEIYKQKGQIEFVTFHQNYSYEEFIEGIKPIEKGDSITYKTVDGIFKKIATKSLEAIFQQTPISRIFYEYIFSYLKHQSDAVKIEETHFHFDGTKQAIICGRDFVIKYESLSKVLNNQYIDDYPSYKALKQHFDKDFQKYTQIDFLKKLQKEGYFDAISRIVRNPEIPNPPYILIIDEINRGNISKIFGELITLIEPSKRIGKDEELRVTLPYSQESFGVPSNLYIIGTMNTADRSITSLDTALRRRFEFVEMMPDATKLGSVEVIHNEEKKTINLQKMLQAINERIEFLYDREKTIGHAYLLDIKNLDKLKDIFQNKIIPLLQEYFYNDYEAINAVLNNNGMIEVKVDSNKQEKSEYIFKGAFKDFVNDRGLDEKKIFKIASKDKKDIWDAPNTYKKIYGDGNNDEANLSTPIER